MSFTVYADGYYASELDPKKLKHHYYVQLAPDKARLVPGILQQETKPEVGSWLDVTAIDRDFPTRYFVQHTNFNTLVPGSLVEATQLPEGRWKEVKKTHTRFHRVVFDNPYPYFGFGGDPDTSFNISTQDQFITDRVTPALAALYPQIPLYAPPDLSFHLPNAKQIVFNLYYFKGTFSDLNRDVSKLVPFNSANLFYIVDYANAPQPATNIAAWMITLNSITGRSRAQNGSYSFVLELLNVSEDAKEYVVLENVFQKTTITLEL
jgi:hypothetical protein